MRLHRLTAAFALAAVVSTATFAAPAHADTAVASEALRIVPSLKTLDTYGPYVAKGRAFSYPEFTAAFHRALRQSVSPETLRYNTWMTGDGGLVDEYMLVQWSGGGPVMWSSLCMAHNCSDNTMEILFAPGRRTAWGAFRADRHVGILGAPSTAEKALLVALIATKFARTGNELVLPLDAAGTANARAWIKTNGSDPAHFFSRESP